MNQDITDTMGIHGDYMKPVQLYFDWLSRFGGSCFWWHWNLHSLVRVRGVLPHSLSYLNPFGLLFWNTLGFLFCLLFIEEKTFRQYILVSTLWNLVWFFHPSRPWTCQGLFYWWGHSWDASYHIHWSPYTPLSLSNLHRCLRWKFV